MTLKKDLELIKDKEFVRKFMLIAIPIVIQNLFSTSLNFIDGIMIGGIGSASGIASVSIANKVYFLYSLITFGMISGATIFFSQYFGNNDFKKLKRTIGMTLVMVIAVSFIFSAIALFIPKEIMGFFSKDASVIDQGVGYLRIVALSYIFTSISMTYSFCMRSMHETIFPMIVSIVSVFVNVFFNYIFIFGKLGAPRLEVRGAAIGTIIARVVELILIVAFANRKNSKIKASISELMNFNGEHVRAFLKVAIPVILNESFWALGIIVYTLAYSKLGTESLASVDIGSNVSEIFFVLSFGICNAASIMIGNNLGAKNIDRAKEVGRVFIYFATAVGIITGLLLWILTNPILNLYTVDAVTKTNAYQILIVNAFMMPIRFLNILFIVGIFRGGGDTRFALFTEVVSLWFIGIPLTFVLLYLGFPIVIVYGAHLIEEITKTIISVPRYKKEKWLKRVIGND